MTESNSMADNVQKGRGIVKKEPFKVVGIDDQDRETSGHQLTDKRLRGRPVKDSTWSQVGQSAEDEQS